VTPNGNYTLQLTCDSVTTELQGGEGQSILDVALQNKIDVPYSCQGGVCSSCIARVIKGSAAMTSNQILTDGEIEEGLVLSCQAHPTTPDIAVDFDDV
jgi:ring-1,2-phenylacetyl-CoA epoxidase subunit PaaE